MYFYLHGDNGILVICLFVCLMMCNTTFNNISAISWRLVSLEKNTDLSQVTDKLYHIMLYTSPWSRFELTTSVVIGTDCIGSCKSNYHTITATVYLYIDICYIYLWSSIHNWVQVLLTSLLNCLLKYKKKKNRLKEHKD
jgi:hypothetical protein